MRAMAAGSHCHAAASRRTHSGDGAGSGSSTRRRMCVAGGIERACCARASAQPSPLPRRAGARPPAAMLLFAVPPGEQEGNKRRQRCSTRPNRCRATKTRKRKSTVLKVSLGSQVNADIAQPVREAGNTRRSGMFDAARCPPAARYARRAARGRRAAKMRGSVRAQAV